MVQPDLARMAQRLSLSKGTISKALNGQPGVGVQTRQRVLAAAKQYGYIPNRQAQVLRQGRNPCIQLQLPTLTDLNYSEQLEDIYQAVARLGYEMMVTSYEWDPKRQERLCRDAIAQRMEGVVCAGTFAPEHLAMLQDAGVAILSITGRSSMPDTVAKVDLNLSEGMRLVTGHLIEQGHRRFMILDLFYEDVRYMDGVFAALREAGLADDFVIVDSGDAKALIPTIYGIMFKAFRENRRGATAVLCANDQIAIGTMAAAWDAGLSVPRDLSVTGNGNLLLSGLNRPALTTVSIKHLHPGQLVADMMVSIIKGDSPKNQKKVLTPQLIVRQSTGPAPAVASQRINGPFV